MNEHPKPHNPDPQRTGRVESNAAGNVVERLRGRQAGGVRPEAGGTAGFLTSVRNDQPGDADLNREIGDPSSSDNTTATPYYYGYVVLGNVSVISGGDGQQLDQFEQDAFGNLVSGNWVTRVGNITEQITTKQYDVDLGLYYFSARWYDCISAVFLSSDPLSRCREAVFCKNIPTMMTDPTGLEAQKHVPPCGPGGSCFMRCEGADGLHLCCPFPEDLEEKRSRNQCVVDALSRDPFLAPVDAFRQCKGGGATRQCGICCETPRMSICFAWCLFTDNSCVDVCRCKREQANLECFKRTKDANACELQGLREWFMCINGTWGNS